MSSTQNDNWTDDLKDVTSGEISEESLEKANQALADASQQTLSQSIKEMQQLARDGESLDTRLLQAQQLIEGANLPSKDEAKAIRDAYVDLLWNSRSIASSGKGAADDFRGDMLDLVVLPDVSNEDKIAELQNWNDITLIKGQAAIKQPAEFAKLVERINNYIPIVEGEIEQKDTEAKEKLAQYSAEIDQLTAELEQLTIDVITPIMAYLKIGVGAFAGVLSGSPVTAFISILKAIISGIPELMKFEKQLDEVRQKREEYYDRITDLKAQIRVVEKEQAVIGDASTVPTSLKSISTDLVSFAARMTNAVDDFSQLSSEQETIQEFLKQNVSLDNPLFVSKVNLLKGVLAVTSKLLEIYSKGNPDV